MIIIGAPIRLHPNGSTAFHTEVEAESRVGKIFFYNGKKYKVSQWNPLVIDYDVKSKPIGRYFIAQEVRRKAGKSFEKVV